MRFVTIMGLTLIAKAINEAVFTEHAKLFAVIVIISLIVDIFEFVRKWNK